MFKEFLKFLLLYVICLIGIHTYTSVTPTWLTSPYFRAGSQLIIISATGNSSKPAFVFTFSSALSGIPNLAYGIKNYRAVDTMKSFGFEVRRENLTPTTFGVSIQAADISKIFNLAVPYLAVDPLFPHHLNSFDNVALNYSSGSLSNLSTLSMSATLHTQIINYTEQSYANKYKTFGARLSANKIVVFLTSFSITCFGKETLQFSIESNVLNTTHYQLTGKAFYNVTLHKVHFSQVIYDEDDVTGSKVYSIMNQYWEVPNAGDFSSFPPTLTDNMILGLTDFQATLGECGFQYNWDFMSNQNNLSYAILIAASLPSTKAPYKSAATCGLNYTRSTLFYIKTWNCLTPYNFFNLTTNLCQNGCEAYFYQNITAGSCDACYYTCYNCSTGGVMTACTSCEAGLYRALINDSCVCEIGYFDDWYSPNCKECSAVDSNCLSCTYRYQPTKASLDYQAIFISASWPTDIKPDYKCTFCKPSYFVNSSNLCQHCPLSYCHLCASLTACQTCDSSLNAIKSTDNLCYLCNVVNCAMCSSDNICSQCSNGYALLVGSCLSCAQACNCGGWVLPLVNGVCSTLCGDGYKLGLEQCDDGNTNDHDGCSSTCTIETCKVSCECDGWVQPWVSGSCSTVCGDGYKRGTEQCDDGNNNDHDGCSSTCVTQTCSTSCLCDGWVQPWAGGSCSSICGDNLLRGTQQCDDGNTNDHDGCSSTCQTQPCNQSCLCDGWTLPWLNWPFGSCSTICGDGLLRGTEQCDDGNTNDHDGCSSTCTTEPCNISCLCDGWTLPWYNGYCSGICGDGIIRGMQLCDDGNLNNHDGCSSECIIQNCDKNCSCDGWQLPWVNGSCSSVCGDLLIRGDQQCDDGNQNDTDICHNDCTFYAAPTFEDPVLLSSSISMYPALGLFLLGFRIVGLEALNVFQSFQLLLYSQGIESFILSFNIHGYSDPTYFPIGDPSNNPIFSHFNFMYLLLIVLFGIGVSLEIYHKRCQTLNKVQNDFQPNKQIDDKIDKKGTQFGSIEDQSDDFRDFAVHYEVDQRIKELKSHMNVSQASEAIDLNQKKQKNFWGSILFRQVVFDLVVNCQYLFVFTMVEKISKGSYNSFLNFPSVVTVLSMVFVLFVVLILCSIENQGFGQNQLKFHPDKAIIYWFFMFGEKILFAVIMGVKSSWSIYVMLGLKTLIVTYYVFSQLYFEKIQKIRSVSTHSLHLILILMVVLNENYFKPQKILASVSIYFIQFVYSFVLSFVFLISLVFYVRELTHQCAADFRKQEERQQSTIVNAEIKAIFDVKQDDPNEGSSHPFNLTSIKGLNLFDDLKTKKMILRSSIQLQIPSDRLHDENYQKKPKSIKYMNSVAFSTSSFRKLRASVKEKIFLQDNKRSNLNNVRMNFIGNELIEESCQVKQDFMIKVREEEKENFRSTNRNEGKNQPSIEERTLNNIETSNNEFGEKKGQGGQENIQLCQTNNKKIRVQWAQNILNREVSEYIEENGDKQGDNNEQKQENGFSNTEKMFYNQASQQKFMKTFSNSKKHYKLKKQIKRRKIQQTQVLQLQSFEHSDIHNEMCDAVSISLS